MSNQIGNAPAQEMLGRTGWAQTLVFILLALIFVVVERAPLWHTDVWAHVKFGQWMAEHGELPSTEPFVDWVKPHEPVPPHAWLTQLTLYHVFHLGEGFADGGWEAQTAGGVAMLRF